jgi:predicted Zn-dependent peptidase
MKKLLYILLGINLFQCGVAAQTSTTSFNVDGIKVIFKPTLKKVINIRAYFRGGVTNYPPGRAGIENLALDAAAQCGTKKYEANALRDTAEKYGVLLSGQSTYDYGYIQLNCIASYFNKGWELFSDIVTNPAFNESELRILKTREIAAAQRSESNPDSRLYKLQMKAAFENTSYAIDPNGDEETLQGFNADDLKSYYKSLLNKNRIFIVAVGNIDKQELFEKILAAFADIPSFPYVGDDLKTPVWTDKKMVSEQRNLKIDYVGAVLPAPNFTSVDYVPFRLAISGLSGNLNMALRSMTSLSYNPFANALAFKMPLAIMSASSSYPKEVMRLMMLTGNGKPGPGRDPG